MGTWMHPFLDILNFFSYAIFTISQLYITFFKPNWKKDQILCADDYSPSLLIFPFRTADEAIHQLLSSGCSSDSKTNQTQSLNLKISPTFSRQDWHFFQKSCLRI